MKFARNTIAGIVLIAAICLPFSLAQAQPAPAPGVGAQPGPGAGQRGGFGMMQSDPRVQNRAYVLADTNETIPYSLFVSSKVSKDKKAPLIVMLHGMGVNAAFMLRGNALDLAEEGGYILVAPMGYNTNGWYGLQVIGGGRGMPGMAGRGGAPGSGGTATDPEKVRELSEKDVMNVLGIVRKEFKVDDRRTYLMGHSMGGAGTFFLGVKYASNWAAIAAMAPAAFSIQPDSLEKIKDMPMLIVQGGADTLIQPSMTRRWADKAKELKMDYEYKEIPEADHGTVITTGMADVFKFFAKYSKPEPK
jgi:predicted esterase